MITITDLRKNKKLSIFVLSWKITFRKGNSFSLHIKHKEEGEYSAMHTRRGDLKIYKSVTAVIKDISSIQSDAKITFDFQNKAKNCD